MKRKTEFTRSVRYVAAVAVLLAMASCGPKANREVTAAYVPAGYYLPFLVAEDLKLFEKRGYHLELRRFNSNSDMINAFLNRQLDLTSQSSLTMFAISEEHPASFQFIYGQYCRGYSLVVPKNGGIGSVTDLRGKTVGTWQSPTAEACLKILLKRASVPIEDVKIIRFGADQVASQLQNGTVDAVFLFDVPAENLVASGNFKYLKRSAMDDVIRDEEGHTTLMFNGGGFIHPGLGQSDPAKTAAIREVLAESVRYIVDHSREARSILASRLKVSDEVAQKAALDEFHLLDDAMLASAQQTWRLCKEFEIVRGEPKNLQALFNMDAKASK